MKKYYLFDLTVRIIVIAFFMTGCQQPQNTTPDNVGIKEQVKVLNKHIPSEHLERVSMIELISTPARFEGKSIAVTGVISLKFETNILFMHKEDYLFGVVQNSIWVDVDRQELARWEKLESNYVDIIGEFDSNNHGHMGMFKGAIKNIKSLVPRYSRESKDSN